MVTYVVIIMIVVLTIYELTINDEDVFDIEMSNREYEKRFIFAVSKIDTGNINWTIEALREIKGNSKYYCSNPKAIAILNKLESAVTNKNKNVVDFIKSCYFYN